MKGRTWHEIGIPIDTNPDNQPEDSPMIWQTPAFEDIRFGFEVTMYICNR
jgi:coenzyme PQQ precursor peptide PqqA